MSWNYRVLKWEEPGEEPYLKVCEVYYTATGGLQRWSDTHLAGTTFNELQDTLRKIDAALKLPALDPKHFTQ